MEPTNERNESIGWPANQPKIKTFNIERTFKSRLHTIFAISYLLGTNGTDRTEGPLPHVMLHF